MSPHTTRFLGLVNRHFYAVTQLVVHRQQTLDFSPGELATTQEVLSEWLSDPTQKFILSNVRSIAVVGYEAYDDDTNSLTAKMDLEAVDTMWIPLVNVITKAARLTDLTFAYGAQVPICLLHALHEYHPKARLHVRQWSRLQALDHTDEAELALANSPCLYSIQAVLGTQSTLPYLEEAAFERILALAPNLHSVHLERQHKSDYCSYSPMEKEEEHRKAELFKVDRIQKRLHDLRLEKCGVISSVAGTLQNWKTMFDLSELQSLEILAGDLSADFFNEASDLLPSLTRLRIDFFPSSPDQGLLEAANQFLRTCRLLHSLDLRNIKASIPLATILEHGKTLRTLTLHERETQEENGKRRPLSPDETMQLCTACPDLRRIALDIDRTQAHSQLTEMYLHLAELPLLEHVELNLEIGLNEFQYTWDYTSPHPPYVALDELARLFQEEVEEQPGDTMELSPKGSQNIESKVTTPDMQEIRQLARRYGKKVWQTIHGKRNPLKSRTRH